MNLPRMTKSDEARLVKSVENVISLANSGSTPGDALVKVATDNNHSKAEIRRIGEAYNQSKTLHHLEKTSGLDRLNHFPLIDIDSAIEAAFPGSYKMAGQARADKSVADYYSKPTSFDFAASEKAAAYQDNYLEKVSSDITTADSLDTDEHSDEYPENKETPSKEAKKLKDKLNQIQKEAQLRDLEMSAKSDELEVQLELVKVANQVRANFFDLPFHELEAGINHLYPELAKSACDLLWQTTQAEKLGQRRATVRELDYSNNPMFDFGGQYGKYATVESLINSASSLQKSARKLHSFKSELEQEKQANCETQEESTLNKFFSKEATFSPIPFGEEKQALISPSIYSAIKNQTKKWDPADAKAKARTNVTDALEDPIHRDKLNQVKAQALLNDLVANDDVISSYDVDEVIDMYNQIQELDPEVALKKSLVKGWLRQSLTQGGLAPFDAGSVLEQGKTISNNNSQDVSNNFKQLQVSSSDVMPQGIPNVQ